MDEQQDQPVSRSVGRALTTNRSRAVARGLIPNHSRTIAAPCRA